MAGVGTRHHGAGIAAFHDVDAGGAVHVQVDKAGDDGQAGPGRAFGDAGDALAEGDAAVDPAVRREDAALQHAVIHAFTPQ
ncbi:hypothetical protein D3C86_2129550 [compost metagenome]